MKAKKIIITIIVIALVVIASISFLVIFNFDNSEKTVEVPEISEEEVIKLYNSLPTNPLGYSATYSEYYTEYNNLANSVVLGRIYEYLLNYDQGKIEELTMEELSKSITINSNNSEINPLHKISIAIFEEKFSQLFGKDNLTKMRIEDFRYDYQTNAVIDNGYYYFFTGKPLNTNNNDIVFHDMLKYLVTENNKTIEIFDYYLKCDLNTNNCYNDERKTSLNTKIKYNADLNINDYIDDLMIYKHTFNYEDGYYYWYSSTQDN